MNICTKVKKALHDGLHSHPKLRQWLWFIMLWLAGLSTVLLLSAVIKWGMGVE